MGTRTIRTLTARAQTRPISSFIDQSILNQYTKIAAAVGRLTNDSQNEYNSSRNPIGELSQFIVHSLLCGGNLDTYTRGRASVSYKTTV